MRKIITLLNILLCMSSLSFALELSLQDQAVLEKFFLTLIQDSEGGYVLAGNKPVCINGFKEKDYFLHESENHKTSVFLKEGVNVLKAKLPRKTSSNIILHYYDKPDPAISNWVHLLLVNQEIFFKTVNANQPLFQYVLGPEVRSSTLLEKLIDPEQYFHSVLKNDKVLIGIILGYGVQNALYESRMEMLMDSHLAPELPPFKSLLPEYIHSHPAMKEMMLVMSEQISPEKVEASFGFNTTNEEMRTLYAQMDVSSPNLSQKKPSFIFGKLKSDSETHALIPRLEQTQEVLEELIDSEDFLPQLLKQVYPDQSFVFEKGSEPFYFSFKEETLQWLPVIVASNLYVHLQDESEIYRKAFLEGIQKANSPISERPQPMFQEYEMARILLNTKYNLEEARVKFSQLDNDPDYIRVVPQGLYYKQLEKGSQNRVSSETNVLLHYTITTSKNTLLSDTRLSGVPKWVDLNQTIPGFAFAVKGMGVGESREVYIHPDYGYGFLTTLNEKGSYLKVVVQLLDIDSHVAEDVGVKVVNDRSNLAFVQVDQEIPVDIETRFSELVQARGLYDGFSVWEHYKKFPKISNAQVLECLQKLSSGHEFTLPEFLNEGEILNQLHWNIYTMSEGMQD